MAPGPRRVARGPSASVLAAEDPAAECQDVADAELAVAVLVEDGTEQAAAATLLGRARSSPITWPNACGLAAGASAAAETRRPAR